MLKIRHIAMVLFLMTLPWCAARAADMPQTGTPAPAFTLPNQEGKSVTLNQFLGKWVVLYFYPKDFTSGCSLEAHNFQADIKKYIAKNAVIVGVSVDTVDSHKSFCTKEGLDFILLSDAQHTVSDTYDSVMSFLGHTLSARNTFLIDPKGVIRKVYTKVDPAIHSDAVLADLDQLQKTTGK
jgi:peroxiredoxin Q/BCP